MLDAIFVADIEGLEEKTLRVSYRIFCFFCSRYETWASHVHPGAHTLGMSSTQRVESANSAIKQGLTRASTMMDCLRAITKLNQTWTITSQK